MEIKLYQSLVGTAIPLLGF
ncbi:hypothetical protein P8C59_005328 [Phyllachora maydis]|uniref:Uncharacterized protein n=1 Tax=Phyllachora maydis TaxID=1825666 RepID=A0AAD9I474_9PEZI|nr:hypothetical protein P8C59_005328 [Phyllachora maydis]